EFLKIYKLSVVQIPTNRPMVRADRNDQVYKTRDGKWSAVAREIAARNERQQPVLVGTISVEVSELLSRELTKRGIKHTVLNAKPEHAEREGEIVAEAGQPGAVTIATNMAGRGVDIKLGGNAEHLTQLELRNLGLQPGDPDYEERFNDILPRMDERVARDREVVIQAGGLFICGTERHESRRIDNQLRGRSGRQGDAGSSRFYLSLEDNLMRIFGDPERTKRWLQTAGMKEGEVIESRMLSKQIERAQRKVEAHNFDARKNLLEYDDVANDQRKVIYQQRTEVMGAEDVADAVAGIRNEVVNTIIDRFIAPKSPEEMWDLEGLVQAIERDFAVRVEPKRWLEADQNMAEDGLRQKIYEEVDRAYEAKVQMYGAELVRPIEKSIMLHQLDAHWREHLAAMDYLRQGIHLRSYAQKNPKQEYKREAFELFTAMLDRIKHDTVSVLSRMQLRTQAEIDAEEEERQRRLARAMQFQHAAPEQITAPPPQQELQQGPLSEPQQRGAPEPVAQFVRETRKVGRNEPCPCGSGKKYKHCHGALAKEG
ncbi:MAG TPA: SEC-C metal-binding domain-containing protein, partial [Steroidobacteraceae bacterium]|nr:SEC-C metal-binding domain-containing protein [Steroidobacteraceae bacterium]